MERRAVRALLAAVLFSLAGSLAPPAVGWTAGARTGQTHSCIYNHAMLRTNPGSCQPRARVYPVYVKGKVRRAIYDGALIFGIPFQLLLTIGRCESGLNPHASNGRRFGLFQFAPETFRRAAFRMRKEIGVVAHSYWNPLDSSYAAGYLFATGYSLSWSCEQASG